MTWSSAIAAAPLVAASAISISAIVAFFAFLHTRRVARKRATLDMVMRVFMDEGAIKKYEQFKTIIRKNEGEEDFSLDDLLKDSDDNREMRYQLIDQLNNYELVALGIRRKLFDEEFYKLWFHGQFTKDYQRVASYIDAVQAEYPSTYCEFKNLYDRWQKNHHPVNQSGRIKMIYWICTKQLAKLDAARVGMISSQRAANTPSSFGSDATP